MTAAVTGLGLRIVEDAASEGRRPTVVDGGTAIARATHYNSYGREYWVVLLTTKAEIAAVGMMFSRAFTVFDEDDARAVLDVIGRLYVKAVTA